jgi:hypothetical protein
MKDPTFDLRQRSADFLSPVHAFPGDDAVDSETYARAMYGGYVSTVTTLYGGASGFGLKIDQETFERWKRMCAAAGILDDFLDESPDMQTACDLYADGMIGLFDTDTAATPFDWLDDRLRPGIRLLRNSVSNLPEQRKQPLVEAAAAIGQLALKKAVCSDIGEYTGQLRQEAHYSSRLVYGSVSQSVAGQTGMDRFARWCDDAFELATFVDSARDLRDDAANGRTAVQPTLLNSLRIGLTGRPTYRRMIRRNPERRATLAALAARSKFSLLPTAMVLKK